MRREDKFVLSHRPYAVDLGSLAVSEKHRRDGSSFYHATVEAVWFRRRRGVLVASFGKLWDFQDGKPETAQGFLSRHADGRYGGTVMTRWDGEGLWTTMDLAESQEHLKILRPMLENYPEVPAGFDGWWTFRQ